MKISRLFSRARPWTFFDGEGVRSLFTQDRNILLGNRWWGGFLNFLARERRDRVKLKKSNFSCGKNSNDFTWCYG
ncbi:MAG: hypothetical protein ACLFT0_19730 [Spirulinaceae cyanobacterium]